MGVGVAPKCGTCGNHPRSSLHREKCGTPLSRAASAPVPTGVRSAVGRKQTTKSRMRRVLSEPPPDPKVLPEGWVLGRTCLTCHTTYSQTPFPAYQSPDAKQGKYDVLKQLPNTSEDYPICETCLPWHWRSMAAFYGMKAEVIEVYEEVFAA